MLSKIFSRKWKKYLILMVCGKNTQVQHFCCKVTKSYNAIQPYYFDDAKAHKVIIILKVRQMIDQSRTAET